MQPPSSSTRHALVGVLNAASMLVTCFFLVVPGMIPLQVLSLLLAPFKRLFILAFGADVLPLSRVHRWNGYAAVVYFRMFSHLLETMCGTRVRIVATNNSFTQNKQKEDYVDRHGENGVDNNNTTNSSEAEGALRERFKRKECAASDKFRSIPTVGSSISGLPYGESALYLSNHPSEADWMYAWIFARLHGSLKRLVVVLKDAIRHLPGLGWAMQTHRYIFLTRNGKDDIARIEYTCKRLAKDNFKPLLVLFPEGTDFQPAKLERSLEFARRIGWPADFKRVLVPRTKGFVAAFQSIRTGIDAVYDVTVAYDGVATPTFWSALSGSCPKRVHMHVVRFALDELPTNNQELERWLIDRYIAKDKLLADFHAGGGVGFAATELTPDPTWSSPDRIGGWLSFITYWLGTFCVIGLIYYVTWFRWCWFAGVLFLIVSEMSPMLRHWRRLEPHPDSQKREPLRTNMDFKLKY